MLKEYKYFALLCMLADECRMNETDKILNDGECYSLQITAVHWKFYEFLL